MGIGAVIKALANQRFPFLDDRVALAVIVVIMLMSFFLVLPKFKVYRKNWIEST